MIMPAGRTHDRITLIALPFVSGATLVFSRSSRLTLIVSAAFLFSGLMFGPDLDIHSRQFRRWGWLRWLWLPYRKLLRHRSLLSHGPVVGTTLRLVYLGLWLLLLAGAAIAISTYLGQMAWDWQAGIALTRHLILQYSLELFALLVGLELGAMSHYLSDWSSSTYQHLRRMFKLKGKR